MKLPDKDFMQSIILYIGSNSLAFPVVSINALLKGVSALGSWKGFHYSIATEPPQPPRPPY
jgi:hypothetical protein